MDATLAEADLTLAEFRATLDGPEPSGLTPPLAALWRDALGDWEGAHRLAQDDPGGAWVHAYLHRKEGDSGNAAYWYRRARRPFCPLSLEAEWAEIVEFLLRSPT